MAKFQVKFNDDKCKGCGLCGIYCPVEIVYMQKDVINAHGYQVASVSDMEKCIGCQNCANMCPDSVISIFKVAKSKKAS